MDSRSSPPPHRSGQGAILEWLAAAHARAEQTLRGIQDPAEAEAIARRLRKLVLRFGCSTDRIHYRDAFLDDFTHTDWARMRIFRLDEHPAGLLERGKGTVDLVHTELCTLHLDPSQHLPEQLVVQTLFADGVVRYRVSRPGPGRPEPAQPALELLAARDEIVPDSGDAMTWMVSDFGMQMTLSRRVPDQIRAALGAFLERLGNQAGLGVARLCDQAVFAIHPGGPRIIDQLAEHLGLAPEQVRASNAILREHGNMSSATLPHVWRAILADPAVPDGTPVVALAFGPGLTIAGAVLRKRG
jgi:hypothetical protein